MTHLLPDASDIHSGTLPSGPLKVGKDWPGVFMRGDEALSYARTIRMAQKANMDMPTNVGSLLDGLARILESCRVNQH